ncbi:MAG: hypothetical protein IKA01_03610 [Alistipes sp.]|nr:hypothetical protein [Alistipes sp.]
MKKLYLVVVMLLCLSSLSAQTHRTNVPILSKYSESVDIEINMRRLMNEVITLDFSECGSLSTIYSIKSKDTVWLRKVKDPSIAKEYRHFEIKYNEVSAKDLEGKEFVVKQIERDIVGQYQRSFYSVLTLENIMDAHDVYVWRVETSSNYAKVSNENIRIRSKRWSEIVNQYICDGKFYYYHSPAYAKPSVENGHTEYVKIQYEECDFFLGGDYFTGRYISKYKDEEGRNYLFDEYVLRDSEFPITEEKYNTIVANNIALRKSAGNYYFTLSKVVKPANKSIRYGKTEVRASDGLFSQYFYEDNIISILIMGGKKQFEFSLTNKMTNSIKIVWDEASLVDENNMVSKVVHKGVKYINAQDAQPATTIPGGASISELIAPTNRIEYADGWYQQAIVSSNKGNDPDVIGKTIKVLLPIEVNGIINEYVFCFTIGWKFTYPEYQN